MECLECAICLEPLADHEKQMDMPACKHVFHTQCFLDYIKHSNGTVTCPECRHVVIELPVIEPPAMNINNVIEEEMLPYSTTTQTHAPLNRTLYYRHTLPVNTRQDDELPENVHKCITSFAALLFVIWIIYLTMHIPVPV